MRAVEGVILITLNIVVFLVAINSERFIDRLIAMCSLAVAIIVIPFVMDDVMGGDDE